MDSSKKVLGKCQTNKVFRVLRAPEVFHYRLLNIISCFKNTIVYQIRYCWSLVLDIVN